MNSGGKIAGQSLYKTQILKIIEAKERFGLVAVEWICQRDSERWLLYVKISGRTGGQVGWVRTQRGEVRVFRTLESAWRFANLIRVDCFRVCGAGVANPSNG